MLKARHGASSRPKIKICALLLQSEAINQAGHGRMDVATKAILAGVNLALSLRNEAIIMSRLVEAASLTVTFQGLEQALSHKEFTDAQLQSLQAAIGEAVNASSFRPALVAERTFVISAFRMRSEELSKMLKETGAKNQSGLDIHAYLKSSAFQQDFNFALDYFSNLVALAEMPFPQCLTPEAQEALPNIETAIARNFTISTMLLPALANIIQKGAEVAARIRVTQTVLAVERYRLKHDHALPSSLTDLTPAFIDAVPADPFDGQPLRYLKFPGKGYVVYSIGKDMKDDNGTERSPDGKTQRDMTFTIKR